MGNELMLKTFYFGTCFWPLTLFFAFPFCFSQEKHAHEDAASRYGTGRVHVHGGAHTQEETATEEVWNAGSDEKYKHMENRKNGANLIKRRKSITHGIGSDQHVTIAAQNKAQHRLSVAGDVTNRPANIPLSAYAHHKEYGMVSPLFLHCCCCNNFTSLIFVLFFHFHKGYQSLG